MAVLGSFFPYPLPTLTPMLLISDPRTGRSDDDDSDLVFDSFTLSAILKENKNIGKSTSLPHISSVHAYTTVTISTTVIQQNTSKQFIGSTLQP